MAATSFPKGEIRVLLLENIHPVAREAFVSDGVRVDTLATALPEAELAERIRDVHMIGIRSKTKITPKVLEHARDLLAIGTFCIGTNQVALAQANHRGVPVFNAPFSNTRSVAELIIAEIVILARQLGDRSREVHAGKWRKVAANCHGGIL